MSKLTFPKELLKSPITERIKYFNNYTLAHPKLVDAYNSLHSTITNSTPSSLIFVFGPTGVGKTTLRMKIEREILKEILPQLTDDKERIPIISISATSSEIGVFNWKDFFRRLLSLTNEPLINRKMYSEFPIGNIQNAAHSILRARSAVHEIRFVTEKILKHRRPLALLIDDAQHIAKTSSGRKLQDQMDCIKSFADATHIPIVLIGTYELLAFRNLSAQLSRRSFDIHLLRYNADDPLERQQFKNILTSFQYNLPLAEQPNLVKDWDFFYERSVGCWNFERMVN